MKRVIWLGNRFLDTYHIKTSSGKYKNIRSHGGIKNCNIENVDNHYISEGYGVADFLLTSKMQESCVDFRDSIELKNTYLYQYTKPSEWLHISYIDALPNLDLSKVDKTLFKVISCDFCEPKTKIVSDEVLARNLKYCDYIFTNKFGQTGSLDKNHRPWIIKHNPNGSTIFKPTMPIEHFRFDVDHKNYLFTVGAGDRFAAAFIAERLNGLDLRSSQEFAHQKVGKWLEEVNDAI